MSQSRRSAIVGPHGTGKSTLLESMRDVLHETYRHIQWVQLRSSRIVTSQQAGDHAPLRTTASNNRQLAFEALQRLRVLDAKDPKANALLLIDGFEQLSWLDRWKLTRVAQRYGLHLLVTSHRRVRSFATVHCTGVDTATIRQLTIDLASSGSQLAQQAIEYELSSRDMATVDNVRDFWFEMFDVVADAHLAGECNV
ncbi:MAG: hypothetical protein WBD20_28030 [Pirellulaceae bacterium]